MKDVIEYAQESQHNKRAKNYYANERKAGDKNIEDSSKFKKGMTKLQAKVRGIREKAIVKPHLEEAKKANAEKEKYKLSEYDTLKLTRLNQRQEEKAKRKADMERRNEKYDKEVEKIT